MVIVEVKATNRDLVKKGIDFNESILVSGKMIRKVSIVSKTENIISVVKELVYFGFSKSTFREIWFSYFLLTIA
ncbi:hypothetical protein LEP1GSC068_0981 [Leptospira sp. Fiocruz LV3954]|nr:hypothetical protein LEP1GSC068_0981 [Leptospira sp. Fiocruz LV3954]